MLFCFLVKFATNWRSCQDFSKYIVTVVLNAFIVNIFIVHYESDIHQSIVKNPFRLG